MADQLSISQPAYARIENGVTSLNEEKIRKIAEILNVDLEKLLSNDELTLKYTE